MSFNEVESGRSTCTATNAPRLFLAVDGGILRTEAVLLTDRGEVLSRAQAGETSPQRVGVDVSVAEIDRMRAEALANAGFDPTTTQLARMGVFIAGIDLEIERQTLKDALRASIHVGDLLVENDIHAVLWAGMRRPAGVAVTCGGGINAIARSATGNTAGYLALGTISGEWGGGLALGREVLYVASRAEDGRGPQTSLRYRVAAHFARPTVRDAVADLHIGHADEGHLLELTNVLFEADESGDEVARSLVDRLAEEVIRMARAAMDRALVPPTGSDIVLAGSVLTSGYAGLDRRLDEAFSRSLPGAAVARLDRPTVVGAALACIGADRGGPASNDRFTRLIMESLEGLGGPDDGTSPNH